MLKKNIMRTWIILHTGVSDCSETAVQGMTDCSEYLSALSKRVNIVEYKCLR